MTLGWRLKMALGDGSAQAMADYLGVSRQTLSRWMADNGAPPKRAYLLQWALRCDVDADWLEKGTVGAAPHPEGEAGQLPEDQAEGSNSGGSMTTHQYPYRSVA